MCAGHPGQPHDGPGDNPQGLDAGAYYVEGLPSYYLDGDEPPGHWLGQAAGSLGLSGEVAEADFIALMAGRHPLTSEPLGRPYRETSVQGFDVTASAPKSVSVLFALGDDRVRAAALDAHRQRGRGGVVGRGPGPHPLSG